MFTDYLDAAEIGRLHCFSVLILHGGGLTNISLANHISCILMASLTADHCNVSIFSAVSLVCLTLSALFSHIDNQHYHSYNHGSVNSGSGRFPPAALGSA